MANEILTTSVTFRIASLIFAGMLLAGPTPCRASIIMEVLEDTPYKLHLLWTVDKPDTLTQRIQEAIDDYSRYWGGTITYDRNQLLAADDLFHVSVDHLIHPKTPNNPGPPLVVATDSWYPLFRNNNGQPENRMATGTASGSHPPGVYTKDVLDVTLLTASDIPVFVPGWGRWAANYETWTLDIRATHVPEPGSFTLLIAAFCGMLAKRMCKPVRTVSRG